MTIQLPITGTVTEIPIGSLIADADQPRKSFDPESLARLGESLKVRVHVPLLVREGLRGKYIIIDGERRYRAAKLAKLKTLPVLLVNASHNEQDLRAGQLAVNNLREKLSTMEVSRMLADLQRKHFASTNDLAAHIEKSGLPAMTPKEIDNAIELVDLPEWAQAMVDAGTMCAEGARKLQVAKNYPKVLKAAEKSLKHAAEWRGRVTSRDVESELGGAFRDAGVRVHTEQYWSNPAHFNPKTACKGCEHLVAVNGNKYCMNPPEFERKNAEAKAAGLLIGGKKPQKPVAPEKATEQQEEQKAEQRYRTLGEKARDYLHAYLVQRIVHRMTITEHAGIIQIDITDELLAWHAMRRPGESGGRAHIPAFESADVLGIASLEQLLGKRMGAAKLHAALEVATELKWRETQVVCHHLWGSDIAAVWKMDEAFVNLFRRAELLHLVELHSLANRGGKTWDKLKVGELKAAILDQADNVQRPQILQGIYETVDEPYVPYTKRYQSSTSGGELDDEEEGPFACHHGVAFDEDCEQCEAEDGEDE